MKLMVEAVLSYNHFRMGDKMKVLMVSPPCIEEGIVTSRFSDKFDINAAKVAKDLAPRYKELADNYGLLFMDAAEYVKTSREDSLHLDREGQIALGTAIYNYLTLNLPDVI